MERMEVSDSMQLLTTSVPQSDVAPLQTQSHSTKWDKLNYLRGMIEGSGSAKKAKNSQIEKFCIFCTIDTAAAAVSSPTSLDGSISGLTASDTAGGMGSAAVSAALAEPSLCALLNRQRKRSVGPNQQQQQQNYKASSPATIQSRRAGGGGTPGSHSPTSLPGGESAAPAFPSSPQKAGLSASAEPSPPATAPSSQQRQQGPDGGSNTPKSTISPTLAATNQQSPTPINSGNYAFSFFVLPKSIVRKDKIPSRQMMVMPMCPVEVRGAGSLAFCSNNRCEYAHILPGKMGEMVNISDEKTRQRNMASSGITARDGSGAVFNIAPNEIDEQTAGSLFAFYLRNERRHEELKHLGAVSHDLCTPYRSTGKCDFSVRCLRIHSRKVVVDKIPVDAATHLDEELITPALALTNSNNNSNSATPDAEKERALVSAFIRESGLRTVGDLCRLSDETFGILIARYEKRPELASILSRIGALWRLEDRALPLELAVLRFPGVSRSDTEVIPECFRTVGQLVDAKVKDIANCGMTMSLLEACLQIRGRNRDDDGPLYKQIALGGLPRSAFLVRMTEEVCKFRANAHASWRKQDASRPIVTSLITYVDPSTCRCKVGSSSGSATSSPQNTNATPSPTPTPAPAPASSSASPAYCTETYPWANHWCKCPRQFERAVNYELSTPSGSRCSEQNCLGMLASKMLPTDAIREVFVHGSHHNGEDPNPLFPCGVCENMLRRVGKDINKKTGGQLLIFMFSAVENPRKLVWMPVTEISHREGSVFKRFLEEEVR